ncbi:Uncharacterised protein [Bordetella pertussis]|nr:Uncharacterised protein [Bordetella pertussis]CPN98874.1 Uncharacterised protein [Bordetella pertussis]
MGVTACTRSTLSFHSRAQKAVSSRRPTTKFKAGSNSASLLSWARLLRIRPIRPSPSTKLPLASSWSR